MRKFILLFTLLAYDVSRTCGELDITALYEDYQVVGDSNEYFPVVNFSSPVYESFDSWSEYGYRALSYLQDQSVYDPNAFNAYMNKVCQHRKQGEYFRVEDLTEKNCHHVGRCHLLKGNFFLDQLTCEPGNWYDVDAQKCKVREQVTNCDRPWANGTKVDKPLSKRSRFCNEEHCPKDTCYCSKDGTEIPGGLNRTQTPQMISINFQSAVGQLEANTFTRIFPLNKYNPNGCSIKGNWFVSHKYSNYIAIEQLKNAGHEIASMSVTRTDSNLYWTKPKPTTYHDEYVGSRQILRNFADVDFEDVVGLRVPYFYLGGEPQFQMMEKNGFLYDSTVAVAYNVKKLPVWPYNVKFGMPHACHSFTDDNCPDFEKPYNVWEIPLNELDPSTPFRKKTGCATLSNCPLKKPTELVDTLKRHFVRHYFGNRAPIVLTFDAGYFNQKGHFLRAFIGWMDDVMSNFKDTYFVTNTQIIDWINNPTPVSELKDFELWKGKTCRIQRRPTITCVEPKTCELKTKNEIVFMFTCSQCPKFYPWLLDPAGLNEKTI